MPRKYFFPHIFKDRKEILTVLIWTTNRLNVHWHCLNVKNQIWEETRRSYRKGIQISLIGWYFEPFPRRNGSIVHHYFFFVFTLTVLTEFFGGPDDIRHSFVMCAVILFFLLLLWSDVHWFYQMKCHLLNVVFNIILYQKIPKHLT